MQSPSQLLVQLPPGRAAPLSKRTVGDETAKALAATRWSDEKLSFNGDSYFDGLERDIAEAKHSVDYEVYIVEDDELSRRICAALIAAEARGVQVRMMVDGVGAGAWVRRRGMELVQGGVALRVFHPLPTLLFTSAIWSLAGLRTLLRLTLKINRRNHRKVCVIDGRIAWVGSVNLSARHCTVLSGCDAWHDTSARVMGEAIHELSRAFNYTWRRAWRYSDNQMMVPFIWRGHKPTKLSGLVRLNNKLALRRSNYRDLLDRIDAAKSRIWITNAYFVPRGGFLRAIGNAARNGIDVRILVPSKSDILFMPWVAAAFYYGLLKNGVHVYEYQPSILHAKTMLIDDWMTVGSSNLNGRSMFHDLEADVVLHSPDSLRALEENFQRDLEKSKEVLLPDWQKRPLLQRWLGRLALRAKRWI
jgi:cardiolipin synthase A/B